MAAEYNGLETILERIEAGEDTLAVVQSAAAEMPEVGALLQSLQVQFEVNALGQAAGVDVANALESMLRDLQTLPKGEGDACPLKEDLKLMAEIKDIDLFPLVNSLLDDIKTHDKVNDASGAYNLFNNHNPRRLEMTWDWLIAYPKVSEAISRCIALLMEGGLDEATASNEVKMALGNAPTKHITAKTPAKLLIAAIKGMMMKDFLQVLLLNMEVVDMPLVEGQAPLETAELQSFERALEATMGFYEMDGMIYMYSIANDLGQAQTGNETQAKSYFRSREAIPEKEIDNNFGYVYLTQEQAAGIGVLPGEGPSIEMRYFNEPYLAIPVGLYFAHKAKDTFASSVDHLKALAAEHPGTPIQAYYDALIMYYAFPMMTEKRGEAFIEEYHDICYEAERLWVAYMRYAHEAKLPYIHIHPFEKYETTSTKSHDLALAPLNHAETQTYVDAKANFNGNLAGFLDKQGISERYPKMTAETMRLVESATMLSVTARLGTTMSGTIAQNIPNEDPGKREGIVTLCDTAFAREKVATSHGQRMEMADPLGALAAAHKAISRVAEQFISFYKLKVVSHELNHNAFRGKDQVHKGNGKGLEINLIEEAKATNGLAFAFENPYELTAAEVQRFREAVPLFLAWMLMRFQAFWLARYKSGPYLREGAVMIDHALMNSGLLEIKHVRLDAQGEPQVFELAELRGEDMKQGFEIFQYNISDQAIRYFVAACADFIKDLAPDYHKTEGFEGQLNPDTVIPDNTEYDIWHALLRNRLAADIAAKEANGASEADIAPLRQAFDKVLPPRKKEAELAVEALISFSAFEQPGRMRAAVAHAHGLQLDAPELDEKVEALKQTLLADYPALRS